MLAGAGIDVIWVTDEGGASVWKSALWWRAAFFEFTCANSKSRCPFGAAKCRVLYAVWTGVSAQWECSRGVWTHMQWVCSPQHMHTHASLGWWSGEGRVYGRWPMEEKQSRFSRNLWLARRSRRIYFHFAQSRCPVRIYFRIKPQEVIKPW